MLGDRVKGCVEAWASETFQSPVNSSLMEGLFHFLGTCLPSSASVSLLCSLTNKGTTHSQIPVCFQKGPASG